MTKRQKVQRILDLTRHEENMERVWQAQVSTTPDLVEDIKEETGLDFTNKLSELFDISELFELIIPVMEEGLTGEDLDGIIDLYESPIGKMLIEKMPVIQIQIFNIAAEYAKRKFNEKMEELSFKVDDEASPL